MNKNISKVWVFRSDSNPDLEYETLLLDDGTTSCNCMGWTRRVAPDGTRSCKHTRSVDLGRADQHCVAVHNYQQKEKLNYAENHISQIPKLGQRKIAV